MKKYLPCPNCERRQPMILKIGGLICEACRTIVAQSYSHEWQQAFKEALIKKHQEDLINDESKED